MKSMHSSTSNSRRDRIGRATAALLALVAVYCAGTEVLTRRLLSPASKVQRVLEQEITEAAALRSAPARRAKMC